MTDGSTLGEVFLYVLTGAVVLGAGAIGAWLVALLLRIGEGIESIQDRVDRIERLLRRSDRGAGES